MENLYKKMNGISNVICKILCALVVVVVALNAGTVLLQILNRHVIVRISDVSLSWTDELARYSMIWMCYLIIPVVYREGSMAQLDLLFDRMGKKGRMTLYILTRILCMVFIVIAVYYGAHIVASRMMFKSSIMRIPGWALYSAPIFGSVLVAYEMITELVGVFAGVLEPFYAGNKRPYPETEEGENE